MRVSRPSATRAARSGVNGISAVTFFVNDGTTAGSLIIVVAGNLREMAMGCALFFFMTDFVGVLGVGGGMVASIVLCMGV